MNVSVVRPLVDRLYDLNDLSVGMSSFVLMGFIVYFFFELKRNEALWYGYWVFRRGGGVLVALPVVFGEHSSTSAFFLYAI